MKTWKKTPQFHSALEVIKKLQEHGYIAVLAGGCVRDTMLDLEPKDYDIASNIGLSEIMTIFPDVQPVGKAFGVYLVNGNEIASLRTEDTYSDGRHPDNVTFVNSLEEDSKRRDFTINAMYYDPIINKWYDFHEGKLDLEERLINFVGDPEDRIKEDKIRMLRAVRFANRFSFIIGKPSFEAIQYYAREILDVAQERVGVEINKMWEQVEFKHGILLDLLISGMLEHLIPEMVPMIGCEQPKEFHPEGDCWKHTIEVLKHLQENASPELCWATLLHDVGKPAVRTWDAGDKRWRFNAHDIKSEEMTRLILGRFKYSNDFIDQVCELVVNHMRFAYVDKMKESKLKRFLSLPNFHWHIALHNADCLGSHGDISNSLYCEQKIKDFAGENNVVSLPKPLVDGHDLIAHGMSPGPEFKVLLEKALDLQLEGKTREEILVEIMPD